MAEYAVAIDLDPVALEEHYGDESWQEAYSDLGDVFERHGMTSQQDTVYLGATSAVTAVLAVQEAARRYPWFALAVRDIRLMRVEDQSDLSPAIAAVTADAADPIETRGRAIDSPRPAAPPSRTRPEAREADARRTGRGMDLRRRDFVGLGVIAAVAALLCVILIRGPGPVKGPGGLTATRSATYRGLAMPTPWRVAPATALKNYLGTPINIDAFRGRAVLVTFLYVHCPNVCPIITSKLHSALQAMSAAARKQVQIVAVSVDPRGDTPSAVSQFLAEHKMTGRMQYLLGSRTSLAPIWKEWDVASSPESDPDLIAHTALVYGVTASGKIATIYPSSFKPSEIVHDVPLLART